MNLADFETLLRQVIGLHTETVGSSVVRYALKQRMTATQTADMADYWRLLEGSKVELQEFINAVIVPETWFFRDREAFGALVRHVRANRRTGAPIRILSIPCSTGEEPYTIAMAMLDAGFAAAEFAIDAVDVSTRNIAEAEKALYGKNSFRGADLSFRARYFEASGALYQPLEAVRRQVRFRAANIFDTSNPAIETYDAIFCRNLLIYFDRDLQQRAIERLRQMLAPKGILLVGPAESSLPPLYGFASERVPLAFAFTKSNPSPLPAAVAVAPAPARPRPRMAAPPPPQAQQRPELAPRLPPAKPAPPAPAKAEASAEESLRAIEAAANAGRLVDAKQAARKHIDAFGPSAQAFYLLGLAFDADKSYPQATENYRKALYLAPDHREAIAHLALLLQQQGDTAGARALSSRLGRIEKRSGNP